MTTKIHDGSVENRFVSIAVINVGCDEYNLGHLQQAHPHLDPELLEEIVREAKRYIQLGKDRYGKMVYGARRGRLTVLFKIKRNRIVRIFSVRKQAAMSHKTILISKFLSLKARNSLNYGGIHCQ